MKKIKLLKTLMIDGKRLQNGDSVSLKTLLANEFISRGVAVHDLTEDAPPVVIEEEKKPKPKKPKQE